MENEPKSSYSPTEEDRINQFTATLAEMIDDTQQSTQEQRPKLIAVKCSPQPSTDNTDTQEAPHDH